MHTAFTWRLLNCFVLELSACRAIWLIIIFTFNFCLTDVPKLPALPHPGEDNENEEDEEESKEDKPKKQRKISGPKTINPYANDESSMLIPIAVAIAVFLPTLFCLCKL